MKFSSALSISILSNVTFAPNGQYVSNTKYHFTFHPKRAYSLCMQNVLMGYSGPVIHLVEVTYHNAPESRTKMV